MGFNKVEDTVLIKKDKCSDYKTSCIEILKKHFKKYVIEDIETSRSMVFRDYDTDILYYLRTWNITETNKCLKIEYMLNKFYND